MKTNQMYKIEGYHKADNNEALNYITSFTINDESKIEEEVNALYLEHKDINYIKVNKITPLQEYDYTNLKTAIPPSTLIIIKYSENLITKELVIKEDNVFNDNQLRKRINDILFEYNLENESCDISVYGLMHEFQYNLKPQLKEVNVLPF